MTKAEIVQRQALRELLQLIRELHVKEEERNEHHHHHHRSDAGQPAETR